MDVPQQHLICRERAPRSRGSIPTRMAVSALTMAQDLLGRFGSVVLDVREVE